LLVRASAVDSEQRLCANQTKTADVGSDSIARRRRDGSNDRDAITVNIRAPQFTVCFVACAVMRQRN
jgi:hypothetical protein